ncbi:c-type cytochrome domain-containing protein [Membranihabitans marinus]|uniref:c-type cytochrome domain-containing protein n=1 Tax=Membranihabitans marinus TaxID=1227546 RepID=UPI001F483751|nr:c-type cytochrome domain-containing protein [Membranihabitans marinus]
MDIFLGRFHPVLVHLPIGFLLLALLLEFLSLQFKERYHFLSQSVAISLLIGAISALLAVGSGWMLARSGGYDEAALDWHRWMGVAVVVVAVLGFLLKTKILVFPIVVVRACLLSIFVLVTITGHLGGNLTHGKDYLLEHAPAFIKKVMLNEGEEEVAVLPQHPDSINIYHHLIQPMLQDKCQSCHNAEKAKGGLDLSQYETTMLGGDEDLAVVPFQPRKSSLFHRVTLPMSSSKFMPPKGEALSYHQVQIIEWWIAEGADVEMTVGGGELPEDIVYILQHDYERDVRPQPFYINELIEALSEESMANLVDAGYVVRPLFDGNPYIEVTLNKKIVDGTIQSLLHAKDHIVKLDLGNTALSDDDLAIVGQLRNLTNLNISNAAISDAGLANLKDLPRLEILNLYGNAISSKGVDWVKKIESLKKVYVWNTGLDSIYLNQWAKENTNLEIIGS